jgi:hypothetical protein
LAPLETLLFERAMKNPQLPAEQVSAMLARLGLDEYNRGTIHHTSSDSTRTAEELYTELFLSDGSARYLTNIPT